MSRVNELEFKDLKQLNELLKNKDQSKVKRTQAGGGRGRGKGKGKKVQHGGDYGSGTPLPWQNFNEQLPLNTQALNANNYGRLSAQGVGSPTAGYGYPAQTGGAFPSLWGTNEPTYNQLTEPNFNTVYGGLSDPGFYTNNNMKGGCGCDQEGGSKSKTYTRSAMENAVSKATGENKESIRRTMDDLYGKRKMKFGEGELEQLIEMHTEMTGGGHTEPHDRETVIKAIAEATGDNKTNVRKTLNQLYGGSKQRFSDQHIAETVTQHLTGAKKKTM